LKLVFISLQNLTTANKDEIIIGLRTIIEGHSVSDDTVYQVLRYDVIQINE
jgi:hypothetical protein